jgi:hypothetical protein
MDLNFGSWPSLDLAALVLSTLLRYVAKLSNLKLSTLPK